MPEPRLLEVRDLAVAYRADSRVLPALRGVSLRIERGDFAVVVGPSGSGKTTMLNIAGLLDRASSGVQVTGYRTIDGMRAAEIKLRNVKVSADGVLGEVFRGDAAAGEANALGQV